MNSLNSDLLSQIRNAVLDLQSADYQSFGLPLQKLGRLLRHEDLAPFNEVLVQGLDVEKFLQDSMSTRGGMAGSAMLQWPNNDMQILGLQLLLILKFSDNPGDIANFGHTFYYSGSKISTSVQAVVSQMIIPFERDYGSFVRSSGKPQVKLVVPISKKVFVVHGHDEVAKLSVARFLEKLGLMAIILHERPNRGRTLITKFQEESADVGFAIVLITPDDVGAKNGIAGKARARQNVVFELGFFIGALGQDRVCALVKGDVEKPSDFDGVVYVPFEDGRWQLDLARELREVGYQIDMNKVV